MNWKDSTGYSQGGNRIPTSWTAKFGDVSVSVTSAHIANKGRWTFHCRPWFDTADLGPVDAMTPVQAQHAAVQKAFAKIEATRRAMLDEMVGRETEPATSAP